MSRKFLILVISFFCLTSLVSMVLLFTEKNSVLAQEWSSPQKEVWQNVELYWKLFAESDLEGAFSYFHPDFLGWFNSDEYPTGKDSRRKWLTHFLETGNKYLISEIKPAGIKIHGNVAIVHYYYREVYEDTEGKKIEERGRWTDILMKQGSKWVLIADHGGATPED